MKRNMEIIKAILLFAEENCDGKSAFSLEELPDFPHADAMTLRLHARLMVEADLITGNEDKKCFYVISIKWAGYEFMEDARNSTIWNTAIKATGSLSFATFSQVLRELSVHAVRKFLGE